MVVYLNKEHLEICDRISEELNNGARNFTLKKYLISVKKYEDILFKKNLTLEKKKNLLIANLHKCIVMSFAVDINKIKSKKILIIHLKKRLVVLRNIVLKLRDLNYYLKTIYLKELKITKCARKNLKKTGISDILREKEGYLQKTDIARLESTVYRMIGKIIYLDQKLLSKYKRREIKLVKKSKFNISGLEKIIARESEMLCHLEAKLPPPAKFKSILLTKKIFSEWVSRIFALLAGLEYDYKMETKIFNELKKNKKIREKINVKINHLIKEKFTLLKLKEKRLLASEGKKMIAEEHHIAAHHYASALKL